MKMKLIPYAQTGFFNNVVGRKCTFCLIGFICFRVLNVRAVKIHVRLCDFTSSPETSWVAFTVSTCAYTLMSWHMRIEMSIAK